MNLLAIKTFHKPRILIISTISSILAIIKHLITKIDEQLVKSRERREASQMKSSTIHRLGCKQVPNQNKELCLIVLARQMQFLAQFSTNVRRLAK